MDDNGNEVEFSDDTVFRLTPKGFFMGQLKGFGASELEATEQWHRLESFCIKRLTGDDGAFAALIFDGEGGSVVGVDFVGGEDNGLT